MLEENILEKGTKTVWNGNCEMDGVEDRNAYCVKEGYGGDIAALLANEVIAEVYPAERPCIINRAGYAQVWGGDNLTDLEDA